ncbi:thermonuclease family protein [Bacillus sp. ISL-35]|nr:thermonuclease family protein [Bacillus sp. ISL-35]MBT2679476.1 thermonuclease family protein [Bacillus sp. ISL-35]
MLLAILMAYFILPNLVSAHNGSRDELGGHFRNADCTYFLHEPTSLAKSAANIDELIRLIQVYSSNSDCADGLSEGKIELEGYTFQGEGSTASKPPEDSVPKAPLATGKLQLGKTYEAELKECTDGDTAVFTINGKDYKTRFLYIDTPESTRTKEPFGPEAAQYTCSFLKKGGITLETDGSSLFDKYDRLLAWVWVGDTLHQEAITKAGLVEDFYDYGNYKYESRILSAMEFAKENRKGMYDGRGNTTRPKDSADDSPKEDEGSKDADELECGFLSGLLFALFFYLTVPLNKALGKRTLIAHRMWSEKWWLNLSLGILYAFLCYVTLFLLLVELLHLLKSNKRRRS